MNNIQLKHKCSRLFRLTAVLVALFAATMITGCLESYGRIKRSPELTQAFQSYTVEPDYKYYYYGLTNHPYAIIGIDPAYHISSKVWREIDTEQPARPRKHGADDILAQRGHGPQQALHRAEGKEHL